MSGPDGNIRLEFTRNVADKMALLFNVLIARGIEREQVQRFLLQCVVAMFSQSMGLLPEGIFSALIVECTEGAKSSDLIGDLFRWMNSPTPIKNGRYQTVAYFNIGLFAVVDPIDFHADELQVLAEASSANWAQVDPAIFGTLFQQSMGKPERHALGAHFTSEAEIQKVVLPTIVRPWRERIAAAKTREALLELRKALAEYRVLDPACGSGNFLYVAYRELVRLEMELVERLRQEFSSAKSKVSSAAFVGIRQFYGIDLSPFAVELAKVTMLLGRKLAYDEVIESINIAQLGFSMENPLPLDNLDANIRLDDALFCKWPSADAIIGNPPYQSKNKMQGEFGPEYVHRVREAFPDVPGRADYCVYWFRKAHDELPTQGRAGLVGTNTVRQNFSRQGGLDYILQTGGTITEAVSSQVWPGEAVVHVSVVNWIKGKAPGKKRLSWQEGDKAESPWAFVDVPEINSSLSPNMDVASAGKLETNAQSGTCYQGQTHGHEGFLLPAADAAKFIHRDKAFAGVLFPFLIGDDLLGRLDSSPSRYVIDFGSRDLLQAQRFGTLFHRLQDEVLPDREAAANAEKDRNEALLKKSPRAHANWHHRNFLDRWWQLSWPRPELLRKLQGVRRYCVCVRTTKRPIFEFVSAEIHPNDALQVFLFEDDYSFGILQSDVHWKWFVARCSTLKRDFRYTSDTVFDSFPWPQAASQSQVKAVASAARNLRHIRRQTMSVHGISLRELYRTLELPGKSPVKDAHAELDSAVRSAFGMKGKADVLAFLLELNQTLVRAEERGESILGPGLPLNVGKADLFMSTDCVEILKV